MQIPGINLAGKIEAVRAQEARQKREKTQTALRTGTDEAIISEKAQLIDAVSNAVDPKRIERVANIKKQIEDGTYEDEKKLKLALNRMIDSILDDEIA
ncbi:MAG: flagellar biosynthesis anti-sigma factor FlgM [Planctomycetes bacterium]|nr:flagellar biosynthesis anti-sigma factor FlgM [Planctomycetota bacterium]